MNEIIKSVKDIEAKYSLGNNTIQILCYANNATLFTENKHDLQRLLHRFVTASTFNMSISKRL